MKNQPYYLFIDKLFIISLLLLARCGDHYPYLTISDRAIRFSSDGTRLLVVNPEQTLAKIIDTNDGHELVTFPFVSRIISSDLSSNHSQVAITYESEDVIIWDANSGHKLLSLPATIGAKEVKYDREGKRLFTKSIEKGNKISLWDPQTGIKIKEFASSNIQFSPTQDIFLIGQDRFFTGDSFETSVRISLTGELFYPKPIPDGPAFFSKDGSFIITRHFSDSLSGSIDFSFWDSQTGAPRHDQFLSFATTLNVGLAKNDYLLTNITPYSQNHCEQTALIYDLTTKQMISTFSDKDHFGRFWYFSPNGNIVLTITENDPQTKHQWVKVWDTKTGQQRAVLMHATIDPQQANLTPIASDPIFSPDGTKVAMSVVGGNFRIWDLTGL